ncbi:hypothetical protein [Pararhizobium gei]|uniref:hypothetical protein n=1 Tax=Pararhizobium gei TaxID=1395951 RepID=UPI0023D97C5E|nr:hypothetical protein [Rhizobium gei]
MRRSLVGDRSEPAPFRHLTDGRQGLDSRIGFRFINGRMKSLPYSHLIETEFDPDSGVILQFVGHRIMVSGRNLVGLYLGLEDGSIGEIVEQHVNDIACAEDAPFIQLITWERV